MGRAARWRVAERQGSLVFGHPEVSRGHPGGSLDGRRWRLSALGLDGAFDRTLGAQARRDALSYLCRRARVCVAGQRDASGARGGPEWPALSGRLTSTTPCGLILSAEELNIRES